MSSSSITGYGFEEDNHVQRLRRRARLVMFVTCVAVALLIVAIEFTGLSSGWLLPGGVVALLLAMFVAAYL